MKTKYEEIEYEALNEKKKSSLRKCFRHLTSTRMLFYYCAFISSWDDRSWFFLVGIYLVVLDPSNFTLAAILGLASSAMVLLFGSVIGSWSDRTPRLKASMIVVTVRNISTFVCSVCLCLVLFFYKAVVETNGAETLRLVAQSTLIVCGVLAHITGMVNSNMLNKDWLPIFCLSNSKLLTEMTARFRLLDLLSNIIAPIIIGQIMTFAGKKIAAVVFSVQVSLSLIIFSILLHVIYYRMPRLHYRENTKQPPNGYIPIEQQEYLENFGDDSYKRSIKRKIFLFFEGWIAYFKEPILFSGLALASIYMTVLAFDSVTIGYALSQGVSEFYASLFNAGAALSGILGAILFPCVMKNINIVYTGLVGLTLEFAGLSPCIFSIWAPGSPFDLFKNNTAPINQIATNITTGVTNAPPQSASWSPSIILLMSGIIASRLGVFMFDLTSTQLLIETVLEVNRGKINGVQNAINMTFEMMKYVMVLLWPLPNQFGLLILLTIGAIGMGNVCYVIFAIKNKCRITSYL